MTCTCTTDHWFRIARRLPSGATVEMTLDDFVDLYEAGLRRIADDMPWLLLGHPIKIVDPDAPPKIVFEPDWTNDTGRLHFWQREGRK